MHMRRRLRYAIVVAVALTPLFGLTGRSAERQRARPAAYSFESVEMPTPPLGGLKLPNSALEPMDWDALIGWAVDDHAAAFATFLSSCRPLLKTVLPSSDTRPMYSALKHVCHQALTAGPLTDEQARVFFENNFRPLRITKLGDRAGLLTGYYEPIVDGHACRPEYSRSPFIAGREIWCRRCTLRAPAFLIADSRCAARAAVN